MQVNRTRLIETAIRVACIEVKERHLSFSSMEMWFTQNANTAGRALAVTSAVIAVASLSMVPGTAYAQRGHGGGGHGGWGHGGGGHGGWGHGGGRHGGWGHHG